MNRRQRFLAACKSQPVDRPPIWVMRQAGRHLPEYLKLKEKYSFHELVQTPELALEVTTQPLRRYDMDAAILFSDILVIPEALGQPYHFRDVGGIEMEFALKSKADIDKLSIDAIEEKLAYVPAAIKLIREELGDERALIGFGGSPWTLATYMIEGGSSKTYARAKQMFYSEPALFEALMEKITAGLVRYFEMQIDAGVDALQIFDSWGGVLSPHAFEQASTKWMGRVVEAIGGRVPTVVFSKGMHHLLDPLVATGADVLGVDWTARLSDVRRALPANVAVQGNLDPIILNTTPEIVRKEATRILDDMRGVDGHIFNLGHGITPQAKIACMEALVETVTSYGQ
ncbi:uroporphyrinogen decarboxylase [Lujinxingia vulgaris]|uniref:Uroporphyrinogen decarboxylase n=1 Tax=Lujinxingia vulgaris TaxID=2600176 RepID=A0A5C6XT13_9DELT|nr:uroporphyrinogen decarboxylase [Lujinxingia vulgaris]TXD43711.1 uroporphyrinogen decarboxylase [Lujinxingia vulgaris]